ncbi:HSP20-like chaperone [Pisolithus microcarpus]|nr:HSP20-like chaperone [Pisolithus microcarpus]
MSVHPEVLWAQRSSASDDEKNVVYLTINLPNIDQSSLKFELTSTSINFEANAGSPGTPVKRYAFSLDFFSDIVPELSTKKLTDRSYFIILRKKEKKAEYWPRLTKEKAKNAFIKTDFSRWVDEDEQDVVGGPLDDGPDPMGGGMPGGLGGGMDFERMMSQMGGGLGGGLGGAGGDVDVDADAAGETADVETDSGSDSDDDGPPPLEEAEPTN